MVRLFVRINVADYETFREVCDEFYGERVAMGTGITPRLRTSGR
jgi:hypothetical protein